VFIWILSQFLVIQNADSFQGYSAIVQIPQIPPLLQDLRVLVNIPDNQSVRL